MTEKIGEVTLNYRYYSGQDLYSDGPIEDQMLEICKQGKQQEALHTNHTWPVLYHFSPVRQNILEWYPMKKDATVLEIGAGCGAITGVLSRKAKRVVCIELSKKRSMINAYQNQHCDNIEIYVGKYEDIRLEEKFDYITLIGVLEYAYYYTSADNPFAAMLSQIRDMLKPGGKLLIAIENRMGLKYFNGAREDHTGILFDGIQDYAKKDGARTFTKHELSRLLDQSGLSKYRFYYPMPDYKLPLSIMTDEFEPDAGDAQGSEYVYDGDRYMFFDETSAWDVLYDNRIAGYFSNSFFVEAGESDNYADILYVRYSTNRGKAYWTKTVLTDNGTEKYAVKSNILPEGRQNMEAYISKYELISGIYKNVKVTEPELRAEGVRFPFVEGRSVHNILLDDKYSNKRLIEKINLYLDRILSFQTPYVTEFHETDGFKEVFGHVEFEGAPAVTVGNIDSLFCNLIEKDGQLYCFDYEWTFAFPVPVVFLKYRMLVYWYLRVSQYLPYEDLIEFLRKFDFTEKEMVQCRDMEAAFLDYVHQDNDGYMGQYRRDVISFTEYKESFEKMIEANDVLTAENEELKNKLERHMQNEMRLRRVIERLKK